MPQDKYDEKLVKCPFFISESKNGVKCEGTCFEQQINLFATASKKRRHRIRFCQNKYDECPHYKNVLKKYEKNF